jgi:hypothetical protein
VEGAIFAAHQAYSGLRTFAWFPNQQAVLVSYDCTNDATVRIDLGSGQETQGFPVGASFAPNGQAILGVSTEGLVLTDLQGNPTRILAPSSSGEGGESAWSPDGKVIYFERGLGIAKVNVDGSGLAQLVSGQQPNSQQVETVDVAPNPSQGGQYILYEQITGVTYVVSCNGTPCTSPSFSQTWYIAQPGGPQRMTLTSVSADPVWQPGS